MILRESLLKLNVFGWAKLTSFMQSNPCFHHFDTYNAKAVFLETTTVQLGYQVLKILQTKINGLLSNPEYTKPQHLLHDTYTFNTSSCTPENVLFPIFRLPNDLIVEVSFFLNEKDSIKFEQCCRLLYKMINNTRYLEQSNNFKKIEITEKRLQQMMQPNHSFFKYCKAHTLSTTNCHNIKRTNGVTKEYVQKHIDKSVDDWKNAAKSWTKDGWFRILLKSLKFLSFDGDGMHLLNWMPCSVLFGEQSQLETILFDHKYIEYTADDMTQWSAFPNICWFQEQFSRLHDQNQRMKKLTLVKHKGGIFGSNMNEFSLIKTKYLCLEEMKIHKYTILDCQVLTCTSNVGVEFESDYRNRYNKIETLRLLSFGTFSNCDLCTNKRVIKVFNLDYSLKNLVIELTIGSYPYKVNAWTRAIEEIFKVRRYYTLENINLVLTLRDTSVQWIFDVLKRNHHLWKYQFKRVHVGLKIILDDAMNYHVFHWNPSVKDVNVFLDENQRICYQKKQEQCVKDRYQNSISELIEQWSE